MPALNEFLSRIQTDYSFYLQFQNSPQEALASYELSAEQRTTLTESGALLSTHLRQGGTTLHTSTNFLPFESADPEFNSEVALERAEVRQVIAQIRRTKTDIDRLTSILALMEEIGRPEHGKPATHRRLT
ncbi:MAG TPA: hypothetical protein VIH54_10325 [Chthoniobacterales bacterium]|jgi:hypothetical protein